LVLTGGSCSCTTEILEHSAAQESSPPVSFLHDRKISARREACPPDCKIFSARQEPCPPITKFFGGAGAPPSSQGSSPMKH
jgi:hypothetical protein